MYLIAGWLAQAWLVQCGGWWCRSTHRSRLHLLTPPHPSPGNLACDCSRSSLHCDLTLHSGCLDPPWSPEPPPSPRQLASAHCSLCTADPSARSTLPAGSFLDRALGLSHGVLTAWMPSSGNYTQRHFRFLALQPRGQPPPPPLSVPTVGAVDGRGGSGGGGPDPLTPSQS